MQYKIYLHNKMYYALLCQGDEALQHIFICNTISVPTSVPPTWFYVKTKAILFNLEIIEREKS